MEEDFVEDGVGFEPDPVLDGELRTDEVVPDAEVPEYSGDTVSLDGAKAEVQAATGLGDPVPQITSDNSEVMAALARIEERLTAIESMLQHESGYGY